MFTLDARACQAGSPSSPRAQLRPKNVFRFLLLCKINRHPTSALLKKCHRRKPWLSHPACEPDSVQRNQATHFYHVFQPRPDPRGSEKTTAESGGFRFQPVNPAPPNDREPFTECHHRRWWVSHPARAHSTTLRTHSVFFLQRIQSYAKLCLHQCHRPEFKLLNCKSQNALQHENMFPICAAHRSS